MYKDPLNLVFHTVGTRRLKMHHLTGKKAAFRILMLHGKMSSERLLIVIRIVNPHTATIGFGQSGAEFEVSTRRLRDALENTLQNSKLSDDVCTFEYPTAPLILHDACEAQVGNGHFSWWRRLDNTGEYTELSETLMYLKDYIIRHGPFDGVVGFSQGATLAHMLASWCEASFSSKRRAALARQGQPLSSTPPQRPFRFSIGFAGWKGTDAYHGGFYEPAMRTPTLIVRGRWDVNVPSQAPIELLNCSTCGEFLEHCGTHYVPKTRDLLGRVAEFVGRTLEPPEDQVLSRETANVEKPPLCNPSIGGTTVYRRLNKRPYNVIRKKLK